ncbi:hypothetical protein ABPG75_013015 [Micractinium tetrahymenae]
MAWRPPAAAALALLLLGLAACASAAASAPSPSIVLVGLGSRQCNAASGLNLGGTTTLLTGDKNLLDSPAACCAACKLRSDCNVWTFCSSTGGCDSGGKYRECTLKQDWSVFQQRRVISNGAGWVSGYISNRCPGSDPTKLLALQRINFPSLTSQCQPGTSCTACMCQLSKAMQVAKSDPADLPLCMKNFRSAMMFPTELGGSSLSAAAYQRLASCPVSDPPCTDQKASFLFGTMGPALVPSLATSLTCLTGKAERDCAVACLATSGCDGFSFNALSSTSKCCLQSGPSREAKWSPQGDLFYFRMPAGTTAEDPFFTQSTPWAGAATSSSSTAASSAAPAASTASTGSGSSTVASLAASSTPAPACNQTGCSDANPPGGWTCSQQKDWGKCGDAWMAPFCQQTCGRCPCAPSTSPSPSPSTSFAEFFSAPSPLPSPSPSPSPSPDPSCTCTDVQPNKYPCADEARWGKCGQGYMRPNADLPEGFCQISCKRCSCPVVSKCNCSDLQPPGSARCTQHAGWGSCGQEWMWKAYSDRPQGYCQVTCGRCKC